MWSSEQFTGLDDVGGAIAVGEQPFVSDAMAALGQNMTLYSAVLGDQNHLFVEAANRLRRISGSVE